MHQFTTNPPHITQQDINPMSVHIDSELTLTEQSELEQNETVIERGLKTFYEVGNAFITIRDKRLYREQYDTFEEYCQERWDISRQHAYHLIDAANVATYFVNHGLQIPENERQARALKGFPQELQPVILQISNSYAVAIGAKNTAGIIERTGRNLLEASITGHVDTGNGFSTPFIASLSKDDEEAAKRSAQYAAGKYNKTPHVSHNSGENEWYTPPEYIAAAYRVLGTIDIDPASSEIANRTVKAATFYSVDNNGLDYVWRGKVWMNPPYASELIRRFTSKFVQHVQSGEITEGIVLVNNATETAWFCELIEVASAVVFTKGRIKFIDLNGEATGAPLQGQAIIYIGGETKTFLHEFKPFGWGAAL